MSDEHREHPLPWAADGARGDAGSEERESEEREFGEPEFGEPESGEPGETEPGEREPGEPEPEPGEREPVERESGAGAEVQARAPVERDTQVESVVVAALARRPDPRLRPPDPAGTRPKHDPASLFPKSYADDGLVGYATEIRSDGVEDVEGAGDEQPSDLLPIRHEAGGLGVPLATPVPEVPYAPRFNFIKGALGALAAGAIALIVLALTGSSGGHVTHSNWSAWKPVNGVVDPAVQIAEHVAPEYKENDGQKLVNVTGGPPAYEGQSLVLALLRSGQNPSALSGNAVLYQLCGTGPSCAIKGGTASAARGLLLRREALELALYTFHYLSGVSQVVVTIPPPPATSTHKSGQLATASASPSRALFFRPSTVASELSKNLNRTLPQPTPDVAGMNSSPNESLVADVTGQALYDFSIIPGNDTYILVLTPPSIGG